MVINNALVRIKHFKTGKNLHSHFIKLENGCKLQEVTVCPKENLCEHDWWIISTDENQSMGSGGSGNNLFCQNNA